MAFDFDPWSTQESVARGPTKDRLAANDAALLCNFEAPRQPMNLREVVDRALCHNPQSREAWASVKAHAAALGVARANYLPNLTVNLGLAESSTDIRGDAANTGSHTSAAQLSGNLTLGWLIFDFGQREAAIEQARQLLAAANASEDALLQQVLLQAARAAYRMTAEQAALAAAITSETVARRNYEAADARHAAGVGAKADALQAGTALAQATLVRVRTEGGDQVAAGELAIAMRLAANTPFQLIDEDPPKPHADFLASVDELIEQTKQSHPSLIAAQAQLQAARAETAQVDRSQWPTLALVGALERDNPSGQYAADITVDQRRIGVQLSVPLFEGFSQLYRSRQVQAQADMRQAELDQDELQSSLEVWRSYQSLQTQTQSLAASESLLSSAAESYGEAEGRYKAGVGGIIDLLNAQDVYASAQYQRIAAQSAWRIARLELAASLGRLGVWTLDPARPLAAADPHAAFSR